MLRKKDENPTEVFFLEVTGFVALRTAVLSTMLSYVGKGQVQMKRMQRYFCVKKQNKTTTPN